VVHVSRRPWVVSGRAAAPRPRAWPWCSERARASRRPRGEGAASVRVGSGRSLSVAGPKAGLAHDALVMALVPWIGSPGRTVPGTVQHVPCLAVRRVRRSHRAARRRRHSAPTARMTRTRRSRARRRWWSQGGVGPQHRAGGAVAHCEPGGRRSDGYGRVSMKPDLSAQYWCGCQSADLQPVPD
jgi:hypothetical protein